MPARLDLGRKDPPGADDRWGFLPHYARARGVPIWWPVGIAVNAPPNARAREASQDLDFVVSDPAQTVCALPGCAQALFGRRRPRPLPSPTVGASPAAVSADIPKGVARTRYPNRAATARNRARAVSSSSAMLAAISAGGGRLAGSVAPSSRNHDRFRSRRSRAANSA